MSRSYKYNPFYTDRPHGAKYWKRQANRKVRHAKDTYNGKAYRKLYNSWEIHDYVCRESRYDAAAWYNKYVLNPLYGYWYEEWPTFEDYMNKCWAPNYYRK